MGCCNSKDERPRPAGGPPANADTVIMRPEKPAEAPAAPAQPVHAAPAAPVAVSKQRTLTVYLVYYSTYGHTEALVRAMAEAMSTPEGDVRAQCFQVCGRPVVARARALSSALRRRGQGAAVRVQPAAAYAWIV